MFALEFFAIVAAVLFIAGFGAALGALVRMLAALITNR